MTRGLKGSESELLLKKWLEMDGWLVHRAARAGFVKLPNGRSFCQSHDLFGCIDLLAIHRDQGTWAIQVTTQSGRTARRRKIERVTEWPTDWRVSLVSHETTQDPVHRGRKLHYWKIEDRFLDEVAGSGWVLPEAVQFSRPAVEAHAAAQRKQKKEVAA